MNRAFVTHCGNLSATAKSSQKSCTVSLADRPESRHVTAVRSESFHFLSVAPRFSRFVFQYPRLASSVEDPPLVSARAAGIPNPALSNPFVPEVILLHFPFGGLLSGVCGMRSLSPKFQSQRRPQKDCQRGRLRLQNLQRLRCPLQILQRRRLRLQNLQRLRCPLQILQRRRLRLQNLQRLWCPFQILRRCLRLLQNLLSYCLSLQLWLQLWWPLMNSRSVRSKLWGHLWTICLSSHGYGGHL